MARSRGAVAGIVLAPGASAGREHAGLVQLDQAISPLGIKVRRIDFPYRLAGRRAPDRPPVLLATIVDAARAFADELEVEQALIALGGRSMGGRIASMAVAEGLPAAALVLVSYPLHPPGRPERLRTEHFPQVSVPCLFVSGDRDAFGTPAELAQATRLIKGPVDRVVLEGGDHGLARLASAAALATADWLSNFATELPEKKRRSRS